MKNIRIYGSIICLSVSSFICGMDGTEYTNIDQIEPKEVTLERLHVKRAVEKIKQGIEELDKEDNDNERTIREILVHLMQYTPPQRDKIEKQFKAAHSQELGSKIVRTVDILEEHKTVELFYNGRQKETTTKEGRENIRHPGILSPWLELPLEDFLKEYAKQAHLARELKKRGRDKGPLWK